MLSPCDISLNSQCWAWMGGRQLSLCWCVWGGHLGNIKTRWDAFFTFGVNAFCWRLLGGVTVIFLQTPDL